MRWWLVMLATTACDAGRSRVYVDGSAQADGDGSAKRPYATLAEGLADAPPNAEIMLAAGLYDLPTPWQFAGRQTLMGAGTTSTFLRSTAAVDWTASQRIELQRLGILATLNLRAGEWSLRDVAVSGGRISVVDATATFAEVEFDAATGPCLWLEGSSADLINVTVENIVEDSSDGLYGGDAIVANGGALTTQSVTITTLARGVVLKGTSAILRSTSLAGGDAALLLAQEGSSVVAEALSTSGGNIGILTDDAQLTLTNSTLVGAGYVAVIGGDQSVLNIRDSAFADNAEGHLAIIGGSVEATVEDNTFSSAEGGCVSVTYSQSPVALRNNTLSGCVGSGISVQDASATEIDGNLIEQVTPDPVFELADAVSIIDASVTISNNTVRFADGKGIAGLRAHVTASDNDFSELGEPGISLIDPGSATSVLSGNTIHAASAAGIIVLNASAEVRGNTIEATRYLSSYALGEGVTFAENASVVVTDNTLRDNSRNGIAFMAPASGSISGNTISDNGYYGILEFCVDAESSVSIGSNTLADNPLGETSLCQ